MGDHSVMMHVYGEAYALKVRDMRIAQTQCPMPNAQRPIAQCPMPNAQCPMPNAQCPLPNAQCPNALMP